MKPIKNILTTALILAISFLVAGQAASPDHCTRARQLIEEGASLKKPKQRVDLFRQAVALCPEADGPHFYYGLALEEWADRKSQGDYSQAEQEYRRALAINPEHYGALFKLAGIEYITGRFDSARIHYKRYLELDPPGADNQATRAAAVNLSTKCNWLSRLPRGSVKAESLTRDPDRFAGVPTLVGDIAFQVGYSAMEVTGQLGYGLAGAGVMLGMGLLEGSKNFGYGKIGKAFRKGENQTAYQLALDKLPDAVNDHGINSDVVFNLLRIIAVSGSNARHTPEELAPFAAGFLDLEPRQRRQEQLTNGKEESSPWLWDVVAACKVMGDYYLANREAYEASIRFQKAADEIRQHAPVSESGHSTNPEEEARAKRLEYLFRLRVAGSEASVDSLHSRALRSYIELYQDIQAQPALQDNENLKKWLAITLDTWGKQDALHIQSQQKEIGALEAMTGFGATISGSSPEDTLADIYHRALFCLYAGWGEYGQAFRELRWLQGKAVPVPSAAGQAAFNLWASRLYSRTFQPDSAEAYLNRLPDNLSTTTYIEKINLARQHLLSGDNEKALRLLQECRAMEEKEASLRPQTLSCASAMLWVLLDAQADEGAAKLEQIKESWQRAAEADWPSFRIKSRFLLRSMVFSGPYEFPAKLLSDQLLAVAIAHPECTAADQDNLRQMYYLATNQLDKAQALSTIQGEPSEDEASTYAFLIRRPLSLGAIVSHETGQYAEAVHTRRQLLERLLPYQHLLPENVADAKVRLAESLAAMGEKEEAQRLLEEANAVFDHYWADTLTARHQRARAALAKLKRGEADIGVRGKWALEYYR